MQVISIDELINLEVIPFDIYNEKGIKIGSEGDILTPGKLLQLKFIPVLYTQDEEEEQIESFDDDFEEDFEEIIIEKEELSTKSDEDINLENFAYLSENITAPMTIEEQKKIKNNFKDVLDSFVDEGIKNLDLCLDVRDKLIDEVLPQVDSILYKSQLKIHGDYNYAHGLNVALLSTVLASKLHMNKSLIKDITLAGMLHDIGKLRMPKSIFEKDVLSASELKLISLHPRLGHKIIIDELNLPEHIANVALQHHERVDGSGYPYGLSGNLISKASHIVMVCDFYDNLISGKTQYTVRNSKEAIKCMLELGSKYFKTDILYTFVHMTNYNDT